MWQTCAGGDPTISAEQASAWMWTFLVMRRDASPNTTMALPRTPC